MMKPDNTAGSPSKMKKIMHQEGDRVTLKAIKPCDNFPDGIPEERGKILSINFQSETAIIQLDDEYVIEPIDDGVREVGIDELN